MAKDTIKSNDRILLSAIGLTSVWAALELDGLVVSQDTRSCMKIVSAPTTNTSRYFLKTFDYRQGRKRFRYAFRKSHGQREFENLHFLRSINVPCPRPLAFGEERSWLRPLACFVLCDEMEGYGELESELKQGKLDRLLKERVIDVLSRQVATMHNANYIDRDIKFRNILIRCRANSVALAHVDSTQGRVKHGAAFVRGTIHDLATIDKHADEFFGPRQRIRFLVGYCRHRGLSAKERLTLAQRVLAGLQELWLRSR